MIKSWTTVEWYLPPDSEELPLFLHAGTQRRDNADAAGTRMGDTIWLLKDSPEPAGLAWEWIEIRPGVIMLADPNAMVTNLRLVDSHHRAVLGMNLVRICNRIVHALRWQERVRAQLGREPSAAQVQMPLPQAPSPGLPLPPAPQITAHRRQAAGNAHRRHMLTRATDHEKMADASQLRRAA